MFIASPFQPYSNIFLSSSTLSRSRKIRCDSTRPVCNNCVRRSNECEYDLVPKRRGPDKRPGTRQRSCKKRPADGSAPPPPKRKRTISDRETEQRELPPSRVKESLQQDQKRLSPTSSHTDRHPQDPHYPHLHPHLDPPPPSSTDLRIPTDPNNYKVCPLADLIPPPTQLTFRYSTISLRRTVETHRICTIKVPIQSHLIRANSA